MLSLLRTTASMISRRMLEALRQWRLEGKVCEFVNPTRQIWRFRVLKERSGVFQKSPLAV
jgi:hypothetical protein